MPSLDLQQLELAIELISTELAIEAVAYFCLDDGRILIDSDDSEDVIPEDVWDSDRYIPLPDKRDLGLGVPLVMAFSEEYLPGRIDEIRDIFRSRGAYHRFKVTLDKLRLLDAWFEYEQAAQKKALLDWCAENGITVGA